MMLKAQRIKIYLVSFLVFGWGAVSCGWAHGDRGGESKLGLLSWSAPLSVTVGLITLTLVYLSGWYKKYRKNKLNSGATWHLSFFILSLVTLILALMSPIDAFSDVLGWVHMIQHTLLMMVAAPLLALASPGYYGLRSLPERFWKKKLVRKRAFRGILRIIDFRRPLEIWLLYGLTLWIWHLPKLYQKALHNELIHDVQHLAFFGSSFLFWRLLLSPHGRHPLNPAVAVLYLFVASLHAMILGAFMTLSPETWYAPYELTAPRYGYSALHDQQIAGQIMWMPAGVSYFVVAAILIIKVFKKKES